MSERFGFLKRIFSMLNKIRLVIINIVFFYFLFLFFGVSSSLAANAVKPVTVNSGSVLLVKPHGIITELYSEKSAIQKLMSSTSEKSLPLSAIIETIEAATYDRRITSLVVDLSGVSSLSLSMAFELKAAVEKFSESGKPYYAFSTAYNLPMYLVAMPARAIALDPFGDIDFSGFASEGMFLGGLKEKTGITYNVTKHGTYKGAADSYTEKAFTKEVRQNYEELLNDFWNYFVDEWERTRKTSRAFITNYIEKKLDALRLTHGNAPAALKNANLITDIVTRAEFSSKFSVHENTTIDFEDYYTTLNQATSKNAICVITVEGGITQSSSSYDYTEMAVASSISQKISAACTTPGVKAIVLRVNSGGGEVFASEIIRRKVEHAIKDHNIPVVISMADTAASGAYWISSTGSYVFANPFTITGSIGVLSAIPNISEALEKYLGITTDLVYAGSKPLSIFENPSKDELEELQLTVDYIYSSFLEIVATGRSIAVSDVEKLASGKIYSGKRALELGLVDELGSFQDAVLYAAKMVGCENDFMLTTIPEEKTMLDTFLDLAMSAKIPTSKFESLKTLLELHSFSDTTKGNKGFLVYEPFKLLAF